MSLFNWLRYTNYFIFDLLQSGSGVCPVCLCLSMTIMHALCVCVCFAGYLLPLAFFLISAYVGAEPKFFFMSGQNKGDHCQVGFHLFCSIIQAIPNWLLRGQNSQKVKIGVIIYIEAKLRRGNYLLYLKFSPTTTQISKRLIVIS